MVTRSALLNDPARGDALRACILGKPALCAWYEEIYRKYRDVLARAPANGIALEIGSGAGFAKDVIPELMTSDVLPYPGIDCVADATRMPFHDRSLSFIGMLNVFHHIPDAAAFLREAERCLLPGGRMLIVDQHTGWISSPILRFAHHEPFRPDAEDWKFETTGPLSGANGALGWIVFQRDAERLRKVVPSMRLERYSTHSPLRYWLAGGLKSWSLLPRQAFGFASGIDRLLVALTPRFGSFVDIELRKT